MIQKIHIFAISDCFHYLVSEGVKRIQVWMPRNKRCRVFAASQRTVDYMACICLYFSGPEHCYQAPDADSLC